MSIKPTALEMCEADAPRIVDISGRLCVVAADVLVLLITWRKTYIQVRQGTKLALNTELSQVLLFNGKLICSNLCSSAS